MREVDRKHPFELFVTNLGKYTEGQLVGEWVSFPIKKDDIPSLLHRIEIGTKQHNGTVYEEMFITDVDSPLAGLSDVIAEFSPLGELNYLAHLISEMDEEDFIKYQAVLEMGDFSSIQDAINTTANLDSYTIYSNIEDEYDLGVMLSEGYDIPDYLENYIDYAAMGRDFDLNSGGAGSFVTAGYIVKSGDADYEIYNGDPFDIPDEYKFSIPTMEQGLTPSVNEVRPPHHYEVYKYNSIGYWTRVFKTEQEAIEYVAKRVPDQVITSDCISHRSEGPDDLLPEMPGKKIDDYGDIYEIKLENGGYDEMNVEEYERNNTDSDPAGLFCEDYEEEYHI